MKNSTAKELDTPVRVHFIDDDPVQIYTMEYFFKDLGFEVSHSLGIEPALKVLAEERMDVIFLDIVMPGIDGLTAADEVIEASRKYGAMVLVYSGLKMDEQAQIELHQKGVVDIVIKPGSPDVLAAKIDAVLQYRKSLCR